MRKTLVVLAILVSAQALYAQAQPAPAPPGITWLRYYNVDAAHSRDFMDVFARQDYPMLDSLIANHQIVAWGLVVPVTHTDESWSHMLFITMNDWSQADALFAAVDKMYAATSPADLATINTTIRSRHDVILRHIWEATAPPAAGFTPHYLRASFYTVKPGRAGDATTAFKTYTAPLYSSLEAKGSVGMWGLSQQEIVTDPSFTHVVWYFFDSLARLDDTRNALNAMPDINKLMAVINDTTDASKYHSEVMRIVRMNVAR